MRRLCSFQADRDQTLANGPLRLLAYIGSVGNYNQQCNALAAKGCQGFAMT